LPACLRTIFKTETKIPIPAILKIRLISIDFSPSVLLNPVTG
jgi:hypothetical protein